MSHFPVAGAGGISDDQIRAWLEERDFREIPDGAAERLLEAVKHGPCRYCGDPADPTGDGLCAACVRDEARAAASHAERGAI